MSLFSDGGKLELWDLVTKETVCSVLAHDNAITALCVGILPVILSQGVKHYRFWWFIISSLSQRLIGELIVYPWSGVRRRRPSISRPQYSNIFSETIWLIKAKFYVKPPWVGATIFCSRHLGHMIKMATTPIYGKNPSKIFSRTGGPIFTKLGM